MNARLFAVALSSLLTACVSTPQGPPVSGYYDARGLPLTASETVALFVSTEVWETDFDKAQGTRVLAISNPDAVSRGFREGFHAVRPDGQLVVADEALRKACLDSGTKLFALGGTTFVNPDLNAASCRRLVEQEGIRYLVSAAGGRRTTSKTGVDVAWIESKHFHTFHLVARAFDTTTGESVCEGAHMEADYSVEAVAFFYFIFPIPLVRPLDESAYWTRVGWYVGEKIGGCFVQPEERK